MHPPKAVFLDRDGTLNVEKDYLYRIEDWEWLPTVFEGLALLRQAGYKLIVTTNQSGIARGYYSENDVVRLHQWVSQQLARQGLALDGYYMCPHHPDFCAPCSCRKPAPGMLRQAAEEHGISLRHSWVIGDKSADIKAADNAGCRSVLVLTGYGAQTRNAIPPATPVANTFYEAAALICNAPPL